MATDEATRRTRRRANRAGQLVALLVTLLGLTIAVAPAVASKRARDVIKNPFTDRSVAKTLETTAADGTRTLETTWEEESAFDRALAGGGAVLLRLGMVVAAAFLAGAAAQRARTWRTLPWSWDRSSWRGSLRPLTPHWAQWLS